MTFIGNGDDKGAGSSPLDRCGIYALRENSDTAYRTYFAFGGTPEKIAQLVAQLKKDRVAYVEPDQAQLNLCRQLREREIEDLLLTDRNERELTVIIDAYLASHPTVDKVIDVYQRLLTQNPENNKKLSDHLVELLCKKLSQSDFQTTIKILKEKKLLEGIAKQAIANKHHALCKLIVPEIEPEKLSLFHLAKDAISANNLQALKLVFDLCPQEDGDMHLLRGIWMRILLNDACTTCNEEACQFLLEYKSMDGLTERRRDDRLSAVLANCKTEVSESNLKLIDLLLSYGCRIPEAASLTGLPRILQDAMENARSRYAALVQEDQEGQGALHRAVIKRDTAEMKRLLQAGAPFNMKDDNGLTPLHRAAASGDREAVELLVAQGASVHVCDCLGRLPLDHAVLANSREAIQCLVDAGADYEEKNGNGNTCLAQALLPGSVEIATIKFLVEKCGANIDATCGADPTNQKGNGIPILSRAAFYSLSLLRYLLDKGAEVNPGQASTLDSFVKCCAHDLKDNKREALTLLLKYGARSYSASTLPDIHFKATQMNERYADEIARLGATPLHRACTAMDVQIIIEEINKRAPINCRDTEGATPLHVLLMRRPQDTKAIKLFLSQGASVLAQDRQGMTALHIAAIGGLNGEIISLLLEGNPEAINIQDNLGRTPLHWAAINGNEEAIKILLNNKASVTIPDKQDLLPYHLLTKYFPKVAEQLYQQFNPIPGIGFKLWQQLCEFYLLEKLLCHRFGIDSSYVNGAGEKVKLQGFFSEITLEELAKSAERDRGVYAQFVPMLRQANGMLNASEQGKQALTGAVNNAFESKIVPVSTGWAGHATGMLISPDKKLLLKANRGEGTQTGTSGLRVFSVQKATQAQTEVEKSLLLLNQKEGMPHFQNGVDAALGLQEITDHRLSHKPQKVGNCTWVSGKLLLRGADYLSQLDSKSHVEAASDSRVHYKQFFERDRLAALKEFLAAAKAIDQDVLPRLADNKVLAHNGIIPQQILRDLLFKCIRKNRTDCLRLILDAYPALLASTENGHSALKCAKGNLVAQAIIRQCYKNNSGVLFPLCVENNIADGLEYLLEEFPNIIDGEQGLHALQKAFSKGHGQAVSVIEKAMRSLKLNQCLETGMRVFDCQDKKTEKFEAKCLNRHALGIFLRGGKKGSDLVELVNRLKTQKKWAHLAKIPQNEIDRVVTKADEFSEAALIEFLLKNPIEIRHANHYLLNVEQQEKPVSKSNGDKAKEVPEYHFHMPDAFLQFADSRLMLEHIKHYGDLVSTMHNRYEGTLLKNLTLYLQRRVMYKSYDTGSINREMAAWAHAIAKYPNLKAHIIEELANQPRTQGLLTRAGDLLSNFLKQTAN